MAYSKEKGIPFISCTDKMAVEACSSIGIEIINDKKEKIDYVFCPVGSGTLLAGLMIPFYNLSPDT